MTDQLFPNEIIENSAEKNFATHSVQTHLIYSVTVLFIIGGISALPFIKTDVSVKSQGIIQPSTERNKLVSLVSGKIKELHIKDNTAVRKGQEVARISAPRINEKLLFNRKRQQKVRRYIHDLSAMQRIDSTSMFVPMNLKTVKYQRALLAFRKETRNALRKIRQAERKYNRQQQLFNREAISKAAFEKSNFSLEEARNDLQLLLGQYLNEWQADRVTYREELEQLKTEAKQLRREQEQYIIRAPISGTIQNMRGIYQGSFVVANQTMAEISPDTGLVAECYVPPTDIGLIREGMEVRFQVSAFDFNQWGMLKGKVVDISEDVTSVNNQPVFTVRSSLEQTYLELDNGYQGNLKKGMTMQARFTITQRSLFDLLYENVDDWLNPNWDEPNSQKAGSQATEVTATR